MTRQPGARRGGRGLPAVVGLHRAGGQQGVAALGQRIRQQQFQLARLVAAARQTGLVVAFDLEAGNLKLEAGVRWRSVSLRRGRGWSGVWEEGERIAREMGIQGHQAPRIETANWSHCTFVLDTGQMRPNFVRSRFEVVVQKRCLGSASSIRGSGSGGAAGDTAAPGSSEAYGFRVVTSSLGVQASALGCLILAHDGHEGLQPSAKLQPVAF